MKERPILFNGDMVRAILEGRKTQTRRVVKSVHAEAHSVANVALMPPSEDGTTHKLFWRDLYDRLRGAVQDCPYGQPGDRLWVRETWRCNGWATDVATIFYKASERKSHTEMHELFPVDGKKPVPISNKWKPSIHMPRWASRITLEIVSVMVEKLHDMDGEDARAEGVASHADFRNLWESINGAGSWEQNPWVWVVEFKRVEK